MRGAKWSEFVHEVIKSWVDNHRVEAPTIDHIAQYLDRLVSAGGNRQLEAINRHDYNDEELFNAINS